MIAPTTAGASTEVPAVAPWLLAAIALGTTLAPLNSTMIAVALPDVQRSFDASLTGATLLVTLYLVTMAVGLPIGGRLGDLFGRRRLFLIGLAWFGVASVGCALAPSLPVLILFRAQQAIAGALALPNGTAIVRDVVPAERRGAAFGAIGMAAGIAAAIGPPLGGLLVDLGGWSAIFWASIPVVVAAGLLGLACLPADGARREFRPPFDVAGSALLTGALGGILTVPALVKSGQPALAALGVAVGAVAGGLFVLREQRTASPLVDVRFFKRPQFAAACGSIALSNLVMYTTLLALPLYLERVLGQDARAIGAVLAAMSLVIAFFGPVGGRVADRAGRRRPAILGAAILVLGAAMLVPAVDSGLVWPLAAALIVIGCGIGVQGASVQAVAIESVPESTTGSAAGVFSTSRYLGSIVGSTVLALAFVHPGPGDAARFATLFAGLAVVALAGVFVNRRLDE